jgi:dTDP-4-dehydrorhamnose 3,5-epimerase-like enzyme
LPEPTAQQGDDFLLNLRIAPTMYAHAYCTLKDDTEVQYKTTDFYSPSHNLASPGMIRC